MHALRGLHRAFIDHLILTEIEEGDVAMGPAQAERGFLDHGALAAEAVELLGLFRRRYGPVAGRRT